jgi:hypothetical protein
MLGYTVVDPPSVLATHLTELIRYPDAVQQPEEGIPRRRRGPYPGSAHDRRNPEGPPEPAGGAHLDPRPRVDRGNPRELCAHHT